MPARHEVVYDDDCRICRATRRFCEARDRNGLFVWTPLQDPDAYRRHPSLTREACEAEIHVVAADGSVRRGYDAMRFILERLPALGLLGPLLGLPPVAAAGRVVYRWVARNRGRSRACRR